MYTHNLIGFPCCFHVTPSMGRLHPQLAQNTSRERCVGGSGVHCRLDVDGLLAIHARDTQRPVESSQGDLAGRDWLDSDYILADRRSRLTRASTRPGLTSLPVARELRS